MHLPDFFLERSHFPPLWESLSSIQNVLEWDDEDLAQSLKTSVSKLRSLRTRDKDMSVDSVGHFCHVLNIAPRRLAEGTLDLEALAEHQKGNLAYIPKRYQQADFHKISHIENIFTFLKKFYPEFVIDQIRSHLQIRREAFESHGKVNVRALADTLTILQHKGLITDMGFARLGEFSIENNSNDKVFNKIRATQNLGFVFDILARDNETKAWKSQVISEKRGILTLRTEPKTVILNELGASVYGNKEICQYRSGGFSMAPTLANFQPATVQKTHCIHQGDKFCQVSINLTEPLPYHHLQ